LSQAIDIRGPASETGWELYEFNRAICRIKQDANFGSNRPSAPETRRNIVADLKIAVEAIPDFFSHSDILAWLTINDIQDVARA
jgi:hypothetical protein